MPAAVAVTYPGGVIDRLPGLHRLRPSRRRRAAAALGRADQLALRQLRTRGHGRAREAAMKALGRAGDHAAVWAAIGAAGAAVDPERRRRWIAAGATGPAAIGINYAIKLAVGRKRPLIDEHPPLSRVPSQLSFPSAHATSSLAAVVALGRVEPRLRPALLGLAALICLGRPYLGVHYPSDVAAGAALGLLIGALAPGAGAPPDEERLIDLAIGANGRAAEWRQRAARTAGAGEPRAA